MDADQLVLLTRRSYDCRLGYAGGEGALFPALSDAAAREEAVARLSFHAPGAEPWAAQQEATEVVWLLGAPFLVQVIEGREGEIAGVLGGSIDSSIEGQRLLDARWRVEVDEPADVVVAAISGDPAQHTFADLARALACAARVVRPAGKIVLLTDAAPALGRSAELMQLTEDPGETLRILAQEKPADWEAGFLWCRAAQTAKLYLLSRLPTESAEELFVTPMENAGQAMRVIGSDSTCLFLPDAHKTMADVRHVERATRVSGGSSPSINGRTPVLDNEQLPSYQTALERAVYFDLSAYGKIAVTGPDAATFLHNLSTNDIKKLPVGGGCEAFLCNARARTLAYLLISHWQDRPANAPYSAARHGAGPARKGPAASQQISHQRAGRDCRPQRRHISVPAGWAAGQECP